MKEGEKLEMQPRKSLRHLRHDLQLPRGCVSSPLSFDIAWLVILFLFLPQANRISLSNCCFLKFYAILGPLPEEDKMADTTLYHKKFFILIKDKIQIEISKRLYLAFIHFSCVSFIYFLQ